MSRDRLDGGVVIERSDHFGGGERVASYVDAHAVGVELICGDGVDAWGNTEYAFRGGIYRVHSLYFAIELDVVFYHPTNYRLTIGD